MMTKQEFRNEVARLRFIDHSAVPELNEEEWEAFQRNPWRYFCTCSEEHEDIIWQAMIRDRENHRRP